MKNKFQIYLFLLFFGMNFTFSQNYSIPSCSFNSSADVNNWSIVPVTVPKSWFNGNCIAMFVDNLSYTQPSIITSPAFYLGNIGNYQLEVRYSVIYSATPAIFELVNIATNTVMTTSSITTAADTCPSWPGPKISKLNYLNLSAGNYKLRVTIPGSSQFFIVGVKSSIDYTLKTNEIGNVFDNSIYPNPTKDKIYFKNLKNISKVNIYDTQGRLVKTDLSKDNSTDLSNLNKGIYIVKIFSDGRSYKNKVVKD